MLSAEHIGSLPEFFADIPDPRRGQGRRHPLPAVLAIDGKTMCNAIDAEGRQAHVLGVVGHQSQTCHTQKRSAPCP